ncbi:MAG: transposase [Rhodoferax sp.]|nr:transposase [Rhodoferax sp.]
MAMLLAFEAWGGVPRVILSDNLKSAVLERMGEAIRFNPQYLAFCAHYRFEPRPKWRWHAETRRAAGNVRSATSATTSFAARGFADVDDLNTRLKIW